MTAAIPIERPAFRRDTPATNGPRAVTVQVVAATPAARDAVTFKLALPQTNRAPSAYRPGQFITLAFPAAAGAGAGAAAAAAPTLYRSYSLCGDGQAETPWEITVKRMPGGVISNYLLDRVRPGTLLRASMPQGTFTLPADPRPATPLVFVAGGSGITPVYGMLRWLARQNPDQRPHVWLHYAYHSPADAIFGRELAALDPDGHWLTQHHYVSTDGRRFRPERALVTPGMDAASAEWYVCGPSELKHGLETELARRGVPSRQLHTEVFASPAARDTRRRITSAASAAASRLRVADSGAVLDTQPGETLLETLERHGYRPDFSCRAGACGTCRLRLLAGEVCDGEGENGALTNAERSKGYVLSCVAQPLGDVTLASAGELVAAPRRASAGRPAIAASRAPAGSRASRGGLRKALRMGLVAASLGLFASVWGLTNHYQPTSSSSTISGSTSSSGTSSSNNSSTSSSSSANGSSSITTQPGSSSASTSTGVS